MLVFGKSFLRNNQSNARWVEIDTIDSSIDFNFNFDFGSLAPGSLFGQGGFLDDTWDWITGNGPDQCPGGC